MNVLQYVVFQDSSTGYRAPCLSKIRICGRRSTTSPWRLGPFKLREVGGKEKCNEAGWVHPGPRHWNRLNRRLKRPKSLEPALFVALHVVSRNATLAVSRGNADTDKELAYQKQTIVIPRARCLVTLSFSTHQVSIFDS